MMEETMARTARVLLLLAFVYGTNTFPTGLHMSGLSKEAIVEENDSNVTSVTPEVEPLTTPKSLQNNRRYKFHSTPLPWVDAVMTCWRDGGELALPRSQQEARHIANIILSSAKDMGSNETGDAMHAAVHDLSRSGTWRTIYGLELSEIGYDRWLTGGSGYCGAMFADGRYFQQPCNTLLTFICEYSTIFTVSEDYNYTLIQGMGHYKLHEEPLTWPEAQRRCESEGASLVVPRSGREAGLLAGAFLLHASPTTRAHGFFVGATDVSKEGNWITVQGMTLSNAGYDTWQTNEPSGNRSRNCAILKENGLYADHSCVSPLSFCCEKTVTPSATADTVFEGTRYRLYTEMLTWWEAVVSCHKQNMTLAIPSSTSDIAELQMLLKKANSRISGFEGKVHIGIHGLNGNRLWTSLRGGDAEGFYNSNGNDNYKYEYRYKIEYIYSVNPYDDRGLCSILDYNFFHKIPCSYFSPYACE